MFEDKSETVSSTTHEQDAVLTGEHNCPDMADESPEERQKPWLRRETQGATGDTEKMGTERAPAAEEGRGSQPKNGGRGGGLPPTHPMHPSQFSGDRYDRRAMMTLLGAFCVMVCFKYFHHVLFCFILLLSVIFPHSSLLTSNKFSRSVTSHSDNAMSFDTILTHDAV